MFGLATAGFLSAVNQKVIAGMHSDKTFGFMRGSQKEMLLNSVSLNFSFLGITTATLKSLNVLTYFLVTAAFCLTGDPPQLIMKWQTLVCF
jgi:hypothetical protein